MENIAALKSCKYSKFFDADLTDLWALNALKRLCQNSEKLARENDPNFHTYNQCIMDNNKSTNNQHFAYNTAPPAKYSREYKTKKQFLKTLQKHFGSGNGNKAMGLSNERLHHGRGGPFMTGLDFNCDKELEEIRQNDSLSNHLGMLTLLVYNCKPSQENHGIYGHLMQQVDKQVGKVRITLSDTDMEKFDVTSGNQPFFARGVLGPSDIASTSGRNSPQENMRIHCRARADQNCHWSTDCQVDPTSFDSLASDQRECQDQQCSTYFDTLDEFVLTNFWNVD